MVTCSAKESQKSSPNLFLTLGSCLILFFSLIKVITLDVYLQVFKFRPVLNVCSKYQQFLYLLQRKFEKTVFWQTKRKSSTKVTLSAVMVLSMFLIYSTLNLDLLSETSTLVIQASIYIFQRDLSQTCFHNTEYSTIFFSKYPSV